MAATPSSDFPTNQAVPLVVVSILNWNTPDDSLRCLDSLRDSEYPNARLLVIDNASQDDSLARLRQAHPGLHLIPSGDNLGFAGGHRLAFLQARAWGAEAICLLNSDTRVAPRMLTALVDAWRHHGEAIYGGLPWRPAEDGRMRLDFPQKYLDPEGRPRAFQRDTEFLIPQDWMTQRSIRVGAVPGSCLFLPLSLIEGYGWLDEDWFMYGEEIDYCYRLRNLGVPSYLVPRAQIRHGGGGSHRGRAGVEDVLHYYRARNEIRLARRHADPMTALMIAGKKLLRGALVALSRPQRGLAIWRGLVDGLGGRLGKTLAPEDRL